MKTTGLASKKRQSKKGAFSHRLSDTNATGHHESFRADDEFFRNVLESLEDYAVFTTDIKGNISSWNKGAERLMGYTEEEIIGKKAAVLFVPEDRAKDAPAAELRKAATDKRAINERYHLRKDGSRFWGSGLVFPLEDAQRKLRGFTKVMRDLTVQVQSRKQIAESQEQFESAFEQAAVGMTHTSLEGKWLRVNQKFCDMLGFTADELLNKPFQDLTHPDDMENSLDAANQLIQNPNRHMSINKRYFTKKGAIIWVKITVSVVRNEEGKAQYFSSVFEDITEKRTAEEKLKQNEERFQTLIEKSSDIIALSDEGGNYSYVSPGVRKVLGYSTKEFIRTNGFELMHPDELEYIGREFQELLNHSGISKTIEFRARHKNGSWRWIEATATNLLNNPKISAIVSNFRDVTERKLAEERLRESEERFALAQQAANIGTFEWNILTDEYVCTPQLENLYGLPPGTMGGKFDDWLNNIHPEDRKRVIAELKKVIKGKLLDTELRVVKPNGEIRWVAMRGRVFYDDNGKPERIIGTNRNVTKRKEAEKDLLESEEHFRQLADSMPQIVWMARPDGYIDYYNKQWYEFTGYTTDSVGQSWRPLLHPDDVEHSIQTWHHSIKTGEPYQIEYRFKDKSNVESYRWFLGRALPVKDKRGKIVRWFGTCTDIDDVKRTLNRKKELEELNAALTEQRQQLVALNEAKDEFISLASHQLRTPATGVKQYVGMTLEGYVGDITKEQKSMLEFAYESNERQLKIIDDLLRVAHVDAGKVNPVMATCDLGKLVHNVMLEQISRFKDRKQKLVYKKPSKAVSAYVDKNLIRMVMENIIDNASKYTPEGRSVTVDLKKKDGLAIIRVKDQGIGIAKGDQKKLFQKFSRIDNPLSALVGGTGLGLYWAKKIIDLHSGTISLSSKLGTGSTFTIKIPVKLQ